MNNLNRPINHEEITSVIKKPPNQNKLRIRLFEFFQNFQEEMIPILLNVFHIIEMEESLPNSFFMKLKLP